MTPPTDAAPYVAIRRFAEEDLVSLLCSDCGATHVEAKGALPLREFVRATVARERWAAASGKGEPLRLLCASCADRRRRREKDARAAADFARWLAKKRAAEQRDAAGKAARR